MLAAWVAAACCARVMQIASVVKDKKYSALGGAQRCVGARMVGAHCRRAETFGPEGYAREEIVRFSTVVPFLLYPIDTYGYPHL